MNPLVAAVTAALLAQAPLPEGAEDKPLPPGHPTTQAPPLAPGAQLPPNHPPMKAGPLEPGAQMPPNHPATNAPPLTQQQGGAPSGSEGDDLLKKLDAAGDLTGKPKTFEVAAALGKLYYGRGRYDEAGKSLSEAEQKGDEARTLFLSQRKKAGKALPSPEQAGCPSAASGATFETLLAAAKEKAKAGQAPASATCARVALEPVLEVKEFSARNFMLRGDSAGALKEYEGILEVDESHAAALFGRGSVLLETRGDDPKALGEVKQTWGRYLAAHPQGARADRLKVLLARVDTLVAAGGASKLAQKKTAEAEEAAAKLPKPPMMAARARQQGGSAEPQITKEMVDAVQNTERTPELEQGMAKLVEEGEEHLAHQRFQDALDVYKRVVPFQPENGRAKAGMAWSLVGLNKQPMADRVWSVAVDADASAVDKLGDTLKAKGDANGAKALWTKLAASAPAYAPKLSDKLK